MTTSRAPTPHPLTRQIAGLRTRLRWLLATYGLSHSLAIAMAALIAAGSVDCLFRLHDPGVRLMLSGLALAAAVRGFYVYLLRNLRIRLGDVALAGRMEQSFADLDDRLSSAVEFLGQLPQNPTAGSAALRQAVIDETAARTAGLDFRRALDARPARRGAALLLAMCFEAIIIAAVSPDVFRTAAVRLAFPWGATAWPQTNHLTYRKQIEQVARGQAFEVEVIDAHGADLPGDAVIHYREEGPDGVWAYQRRPLRPVGDVMVGRRENIVRPFAYGVEGGDDSAQPWIDVDVVDAPTLDSLVVRLIPPTYTGWQPVESPRAIRALAGTRVEFHGRAAEPLAGAALHWLERPPLALPLAADRDFSAPPSGGPPLLVEKSGEYWFELTDQRGLSSLDSERWEIRALPDAPPSAAIEQPGPSAYVAPSAAVPLRVAAKDDLAIRAVAIVFSRTTPNGAAEQTLAPPLYAGPKTPPQQPGPTAASGSPPGEQRTLDYHWDLTSLGLRPGETITYWAEAVDYHGAAGRSALCQLHIIASEELLERIAARHAVILAELSRALTLQRESRSQVAALAIRAAELGRLSQPDGDQLQAAAVAQRQVTRTLTSRGDGVTMHALGVMADLENNRLDQPDLRRRMDWLLAELGRVEQDLLAPLDQELTAAVKAVQTPPESAADPLLSRSLAQAGAAQDQTIAALEGLIAQLGGWDHYRRFHREMRQLARDEEELTQRSATLARDTLGRELGDLAPQQSAELRTRAREQLDLALRLEHLLEQIRRAAAAMADRDPMAAETLTDALAEAQRQAVAAEMRQVRDQLEGNRMGQALPGQRRIAAALDDLAEILSGSRRQELTRLAKQLDAAQRDLDALAGRQATLIEQFSAVAAAEPLRALAAPQTSLAESADGLARRLVKLLAQKAGKSSEAAASRMRAAGEAAGQGIATPAQQQSREAGRLLAEAQESLRRRRLQLGAERLAEQMARLQDAVRHWHTQQRELIEATVQFERGRKPDEPLSAAQRGAIVDLERRQRTLSDDVHRGAESLAGPVARVAIGGAVAQMRQAAALLAERDTGARVQTAQRDALSRLTLLLKCWEPDKPTGQSEASGGQGGKAGETPDSPLDAAEIKLLKLLQETINARTQALAKGPSDMDRALEEYHSLEEEQGRLAALLVELLRQSDGTGKAPREGER